MERYAKILATGMYLPEKVITNEELSQRYGFDVSQYLSGITLRHIAAENESASDLAVKAAEDALKKANMKPEEIDLLIMTTDAPDYITPPTAPAIAYKLGAKNAGAFDVNAACADAVIGMSIGAQHIMFDKTVNNVLVVAPYAMSKWIDWDNKVLAPMLGDGASALILTKSDEPGYIASTIVADGQYWDSYGIYVGTKYPITKEMVEKKEHLLRFHPNFHKYPPDVNYGNWPNVIKKTLAKTNYKVEDLDMVIFTQVRLIDIQKSMEALGLPMEKTHTIMQKYGYTGSACAFMALDDAIREGKIKHGDLIAFCTSGVGYVMSSALFRWV
ncbi:MULTISPECIES: 3-oxoacyl-ACP synthase III family protein [Caldisericum]|jgi:3-oxoacyl-[acyl-carrier-protein] synthase-3|uniref:3-oxoacyl-ACP synthase III family protein n=1 Tax=Caldisericum TaxID=693074 RepID=UPI003C7799AA